MLARIILTVSPSTEHIKSHAYFPAVWLAGHVLARAEAGKRWCWTISAGDSSYALRRRSAWRSEMELRSGELTVGSIRKAAAPRGKLQCELPSELSPPTQVFIGLLILTLWNRAAASAGGAAAVAST